MSYTTIFAIISFFVIIFLIILSLKYKKIKFSIPIIFLLLLTPFYEILDSEFLVDIFGCGCVPIIQENVFSIPFNANDLRFYLFLVLTIALTFLSIFFSQNFKNKIWKVLYPIFTFLFNLIFTFFICHIYMWA